MVVLGMHRSGTSVLTGSLSDAGVHLGSTFQSAPDNPKGNQESPRIMALHDDIMERNGGTWSAPTNPSHWSPVHRELRDSIVENNAKHAIWGFKDPRTLFTLQGWLAVLPDAELIGIFRHPFLVAESLHKRNGFALEFGLDLWISYNRVLLWYLDKFPKLDLVEFSTDPDHLENQIRLLLKRLKLVENTEQFFEPKLRNSLLPSLHDLKGSSLALNIYNKLRAHQNHSGYLSLSTSTKCQ